MTNSDVVKMAQSGMSEDTILRAISMATPNFDITNESVLKMKQQKVSETVILAMIKRQWQWDSKQRKVHTAAGASAPKWEVEFHGGIPGNMHQNGGWSRLNVPGNTSSTSESTISTSGGNQIFATGGVVIILPLTEKVKPFVTVGAGVLTDGGSTPTIALNGAYGGPSAEETDSVLLSFDRDSNHIFTRMFGGGFKVYLGRHWGVRVDAS